MQIRGTIANMDDINIIKNPEPGDAIFITDQQSIFRYTEDRNWEPINNSELNLNMSEYDLNKMVVAQLPDLKNIYKVKKVIRDFTHSNGSIYMLLCNELKYYTVLIMEQNQLNDPIEDVVIECLQNCGKLKDISYNDKNKSIECWIISINDNEPHMFVLFNYEQGVEKCR